MQHSPSVNVTIVKKRRRSSQRSIKSESSSVTVTRVKSVTSKSEKTLVVENVDTISTGHNESSSRSLSKKIQRPPTTVSVTRISRSQSLKSITDKPSEDLSRLQHSDRSEHSFAHPSQPHTVLPIQADMHTHSSSKCIAQSKKTDPFNSNTTTQLVDSSSMPFPKSKDTKINSCSLQFSTDDRREIYTIGKENRNKKKKYQLCQKYSFCYYLAFGLALFTIFSVIVALPVIVVSSLMTTTTIISTTSTTVTMSTITTTSTTTDTTTSVTTATAAATVTITSNVCTSSWMGIRMIYHCDSCFQQSTYASLSFNYLAIANVTRISFVLRRDSGYFGIDDVSIRDTIAPGNELLSNGGFENGSFSSWIHCVQSGSPATGSIQSTSSGISYGGYTFVARSGTYYYLGGATVNAEYLSQTFSSIIGHTYIFSFAYVYVGNGSLSSGDFLLSI